MRLILKNRSSVTHWPCKVDYAGSLLGVITVVNKLILYTKQNNKSIKIFSDDPCSFSMTSCWNLGYIGEIFDPTVKRLWL